MVTNLLFIIAHSIFKSAFLSLTVIELFQKHEPIKHFLQSALNNSLERYKSSFVSTEAPLMLLSGCDHFLLAMLQNRAFHHGAGTTCSGFAFISFPASLETCSLPTAHHPPLSQRIWGILFPTTRGVSHYPVRAPEKPGNLKPAGDNKPPLQEVPCPPCKCLWSFRKRWSEDLVLAVV